MTKALASLLFSLLLVAPAVAAAPPDGAAPSPRLGTGNSDSSRREGAPPTGEGASEDAPPAQGAQPADSADDGSPFDYQASEEISEDLSVSFPVDI
ncbi:MAG TPA: hypothetical protein VJ947_03065 [Pseudohaliea sp.]|nr:hypothetical protein [Pseudohaliea sp.]